MTMNDFADYVSFNIGDGLKLEFVERDLRKAVDWVKHLAS